ncbi:hypothetical protein [Geomonas anaerohicana]|uniref:Uncharacterized protein n=1 Tax=Geomonas anaerohicana TaxID=2798583 RepID=A0ABS0YEF8_9BACT|nr:hypothetical protein [Geomonas anaerohicana]MBJ6750687.1 hypothetical protein [Geomonas anaerohicana]
MEKNGGERILRTEDVTRVVMEVPKGHRHLRTTLQLGDGSSITLQEATVAAIVRAYVTVKTDPLRDELVLEGQKLTSRKAGYAEWQLLDVPQVTKASA